MTLYPLMDIVSLSHINYFPYSIIEIIYSGVCGQLLYLFHRQVWRQVLFFIPAFKH
jgi:hypothetical protein